LNFKLVKHTLIYGLSPYAPRLLGIFILPIITKDLTQLDYGIYGIILAYVAGIEVLKDLGLNLILYNSHTTMPRQFKWMWRSIYGFLMLWNVIYAIIAATLIYFVIPPEAKDSVWLIMVLNVSPIVLFGPTALIGRVYYQMEERPIQIAWRTIVFGVLTIILNLYTITYLKLGYMGWFWSTCIVTIGLNASFWYPINKKYKLTPILNFKWRLMKSNLKVSLPTVPHYYSSYIMQTSDKVILNLMDINTGTIGNYTFAGSFAGYFNQLGNAIGQASRATLNINNKEHKYNANRNLIFKVQLFFFYCYFFKLPLA
jgi:O-antigen/teichoic acid export membrane protein